MLQLVLFRFHNVFKRKLKYLKNSTFPKIQSLVLSKMTTRSQKRKAVAELVSGDFEASLAENNSTENLIASSSKNPRLELENLKEIKTTLRKEIMSDLTKILAENQKEMFKLIAPLNKKQTVHLNVQDSDSEPENVSVARTSTPVKTHTATKPKTTPINSRNRCDFCSKQSSVGKMVPPPHRRKKCSEMRLSRKNIRNFPFPEGGKLFSSLMRIPSGIFRH